MFLYADGVVCCETCYCLRTCVFFSPPEFPDCNLGKKNMVKTVTNTVFIPSWNSSVIFVARQRAGQQRSWCHRRQVDQSEVSLASSYAVDRGALSAGLEWPRRESGYSQSNAEINKCVELYFHKPIHHYGLNKDNTATCTVIATPIKFRHPHTACRSYIQKVPGCNLVYETVCPESSVFSIIILEKVNHTLPRGQPTSRLMLKPCLVRSGE
jgi:hypothetical protein